MSNHELNDSIIEDSFSERISYPTTITKQTPRQSPSTNHDLLLKGIYLLCKIFRIPNLPNDSFYRKLKDVVLMLQISFLFIVSLLLFAPMIYFKVSINSGNWISLGFWGGFCSILLVLEILGIAIKSKKTWLSIFVIFIGTIALMGSLIAEVEQFHIFCIDTFLIVFLAICYVMWDDFQWLSYIYTFLVFGALAVAYSIKIGMLFSHLDGNGKYVMSSPEIYFFLSTQLGSKLFLVFFLGVFFTLRSSTMKKLLKYIETIVLAVKSRDYDPQIARELKKMNFVSDVGEIFQYINKFKAFVPKHLLGKRDWQSSSSGSDDDGRNSEEESLIKVKDGFEKKIGTIVCLQIRNLLEEESTSFDDAMELHTRLVSNVEKLCEELKGGVISITEKKVYCGFGVVRRESNHAQAACQFAIRVTDFLRSMNEGYLSDSLSFIQFSIGIQSGRVFNGVLGSTTNKVNRVFGATKKIAAYLVDFGLFLGKNIMVGESTINLIQKNIFKFSQNDVLYFPQVNRKKTFKVFELEREIINVKGNWMVNMMEQAETSSQNKDSLDFVWFSLENDSYEDCLFTLEKLKLESSKLFKFIKCLKDENTEYKRKIEKLLETKVDYSRTVIALVNEI